MGIKDYVRRSGVIVAYAPYGASDAPGTFLKIGHISGDVQVNDSRTMVTVREFGTSRTQFDLQYADSRTGSVGLSVNLVPADASFILLKNEYEAGNEGFLYITGVDEKGTPTSITYKLTVTNQQFNAQFRQENVAMVQINFAITGTASFTTPTFA